MVFYMFFLGCYFVFLLLLGFFCVDITFNKSVVVVIIIVIIIIIIISIILIYYYYCCCCCG